MSTSKLSQLKPIKNQLKMKFKDLLEKFIDYELIRIMKMN